MKLPYLLLSAFLLILGQNLYAEFTLIDDAGVEHTFGKPVTRIVSLMPHGTELMFEVGAGDLIVGAVKYSDYPEAAKKIPRIGGYSGLNIEAIAALQPDVVLSWPDGNTTRELHRLQQLGFKLFASDPVTYEEIADNLRKFGKMTGLESQGNQVADSFMQEVTHLRDTYSHQTPVSVFYQVWHEPLMTQNGQTFISKAIELCGGNNIYAELDIRAPQISKESVLIANPDAIVASGMGESRPEWLDGWRDYPKLNAVQSGSLFHIHPEFFQRPTSRFLVGTRQLCEKLEASRRSSSAASQ
ncbi:cobalamin-binding protein [Bacterioplanoides sp. SCSIO 12839]|uniref:cobalamin-binding protein n=1 Tax=Bacterioplanoides sp. SCSIO 12839 TaxID=2829569 RepID=UPI002104E9BA|nr:cobalamin-binding protein [Bacterioplanoides sp. SCSIO 12839]